MTARSLICAAALILTQLLVAWEGPKLTVEPEAAPVARTWADVKASIEAAFAKTAQGYFAYSRRFNDIGPIDTSGTLTDEELHTQFAMACILASPITVKGPAKPQVAKWLGNWMLMNVNNDKVARQGHVVAERDGTFVVVKYLWGMNNGNIAVAFYNPTDAAKTVRATASELCLAGEIKWQDRFDDALKGTFADELSFVVPAHGARLVYAAGKPVMRSEYRAVCAFDGDDGSRMWNCVFVPKDGDYEIKVRTDSQAPYRAKVNGIDMGEFRGEARIPAQLFEPENTVRLSGPGALSVMSLEIERNRDTN